MEHNKQKLIYLFSPQRTDGHKEMNDILGGKGAALAEMCRVGLVVPPGFTIATTACNQLDQSDDAIEIAVNNIKPDVEEAIHFLEHVTGKKFGSYDNPLLLSVRSGAKISMPGMMDTILNLGLNDKTTSGIVNSYGNPHFSYDIYRRFIQMYATVVLNIEQSLFENIMGKYKASLGVEEDYQIPAESLRVIVADFKHIVSQHTDMHVPDDPYEQLWNAIRAVFESWHSARAVKYRELHCIPHSLGTAVNVQTMVFGNLNNNSATGVVFTRNPSNGNDEIFGEFLTNAQGEDVVAGIRNAQPINLSTKLYQHKAMSSMEEDMPCVYSELVSICKKLEQHYKKMQDIEFTVENGKLWILQTRAGKCNIEAGLKIASDMVKAGIMNGREAVCSIDAKAMDRLLHPVIDDSTGYHTPAMTGLAASPGATSGAVVLTSQKAEKESKTRGVILVREETSPEDISGMSVAHGILTARGGMTSHAAVVTRGMGKPCVCGASGMSIDKDSATVKIGNSVVHEGDIITINGSTGDVFIGHIPTTNPELPKTFREIMNIADELRSLQVRANAETTSDIKVALTLGAQGIGLCRTEHMFFAAERIKAVRKMIIADTTTEMRAVLEELGVHQQRDFEDIFRLMSGLPTTIRLLDPPLHEFLPKNTEEIADFCRETGLDLKHTITKIAQLHEYNPMLGHRGCRLAITHPQIYAMQARAIFAAMVTCMHRAIPTQVEIMIPLISEKRELDICVKIIRSEAQLIEKLHDCRLDYKIGTMIELPRAALQAGHIASIVDFMSFGTNDLTQTTLGISRDDAGSFLPSYLQQGIFEYDPFISLDQTGVGELIRTAVQRARDSNHAIKLGVCGEHGGDPESIKFFDALGLDYVSCSPFRIPVARLAAAQIQN